MKLPTEAKIIEKFKKYLDICQIKNQMPTKLGLVINLGINNRKTYNEWKKKSNAIKEFENLIEQEWVQTLRANNVAGTIFYLKNAFGYRDRQDLDLTTKGKELNFTNDQKNKVANRIIGRGNPSPVGRGK